MDRAATYLIGAAAGFVIAVAGFAGYVVSPVAAWEGVFVVGLVVAIAFYVLLQLEGRKVADELDAVSEEESRDGYLYYMSGEPEEDGATVVDLTREGP